MNRIDLVMGSDHSTSFHPSNFFIISDTMGKKDGARETVASPFRTFLLPLPSYREREAGAPEGGKGDTHLLKKSFKSELRNKALNVRLAPFQLEAERRGRKVKRAPGGRGQPHLWGTREAGREEVHDRAEGAEENCVERERRGETWPTHTYLSGRGMWMGNGQRQSERASEGASQPTIVAACSNGNGRREGGLTWLTRLAGRPRSLVSNSHQALWMTVIHGRRFFSEG